jgi:hypothetical protein
LYVAFSDYSFTILREVPSRLPKLQEARSPIDQIIFVNQSTITLASPLPAHVVLPRPFFVSYDSLTSAPVRVSSSPVLLYRPEQVAFDALLRKMPDIIIDFRIKVEEVCSMVWCHISL